MKKLFAYSFLSTCILFGVSPVKADYDSYGIIRGDSIVIYDDDGDTVGTTVEKLYKFNSQTGKRILLNTHQKCQNNNYVEFEEFAPLYNSGKCEDLSGITYDPKNKKLISKVQGRDGEYKQWSYDIDSNTWTWEDDPNPNIYDIHLEIPLIRQSADGVTTIGQNSLNFKETDKKLDLWGTNLDGEKVPVNVTSGLLIKGRDVEQSINNVGAMSAALTGLPTVPTDTKIACGLGTGTHGGDFAFSGGCASKLNKNLSINYAASTSMPGQEYAGDFVDQFSARAGFVWQLGKSNKPTQISMNQKKEMDLKISKLQNDNELLKADNKELKVENKKIISKNIQLETKNNEIISQNEKLLARLENLENIAFKLQRNEGIKLSKRVKGNN